MSKMYSIEATDEQIEILESIAMSVCTEHVVYRLPDGTIVDNDGVAAWLLERGIDVTSDDFTWLLDFVDGFDHCEPQPEIERMSPWLQRAYKQDIALMHFYPPAHVSDEPEWDMRAEDFEARLNELFED